MLLCYMGGTAPLQPDDLISMQRKQDYQLMLLVVFMSRSAHAGNQQSLHMGYLHISQAHLDLAMGFHVTARTRRQPAEPVRELPAHQPGVPGPGNTCGFLI